MHQVQVVAVVYGAHPPGGWICSPSTGLVGRLARLLSGHRGRAATPTYPALAHRAAHALPYSLFPAYPAAKTRPGPHRMYRKEASLEAHSLPRPMTRSAGLPYRARPGTTPRRLPYTPLPPHAGPPCSRHLYARTQALPCSLLPALHRADARERLPRATLQAHRHLPVHTSRPIAPPAYLHTSTPRRSAQVQLCRPTLHTSTGGHSRPRPAVRRYHRRGPSDQLL